MTTEDFIDALKESIARSGTPKLKSVTMRKLQNGLANYRKMQTYLVSYQNIVLNRNSICQEDPWWDGFFESLIGIMKIALLKQFGHAMLHYIELIYMNNRPLCYVEEELDRPNLMPKILLRATATHYFEDNIKDGDLYGDEFMDVTRQMNTLARVETNSEKTIYNRIFACTTCRIYAEMTDNL